MNACKGWCVRSHDVKKKPSNSQIHINRTKFSQNSYPWVMKSCAVATLCKLNGDSELYQVNHSWRLMICVSMQATVQTGSGVCLKVNKPSGSGNRLCAKKLHDCIHMFHSSAWHAAKELLRDQAQHLDDVEVISQHFQRILCEPGNTMIDLSVCKISDLVCADTCVLWYSLSLCKICCR